MEANALETEIAAKAEERVSLLSPAARIWRDKELGTRDVDLERAKKSIDGWHNDLEVHRSRSRSSAPLWTTSAR